jgi:hypothetical protein
MVVLVSRKEVDAMRIKRGIATVVGVLSFAAIIAGSAQAAAPVNLREGLVLTEGGVPLAVGAKVENEQLIMDKDCYVQSPGKVLTNGAPVDLLGFEPPNFTECSQGSVSGGIRLAALGDNGVAVLLTYPTLELTTPASCRYDFPLLEGWFTPSGPYGDGYILGEATGVRNPTDRTSCARIFHTEFAVAELGSDIEIIGAQLTEIPRFGRAEMRAEGYGVRRVRAAAEAAAHE